MTFRLFKNLLVLPLLLATASCEDSDPDGFAGGEFTLQFRGMVGDEPFECGEMYKDVGSSGGMAMAQDFRFYVSNIRLLTKDGDEVAVELEDDAPWQTKDVALIDFEDATSACEKSGTKAMNRSVKLSAPEGDYVGLVFSNSVPEELNHEDPTTNPEPLQVTAMQWSWLLGYKFIRAEMKPMMEHGQGGAGGEAMMHQGHAMDSQFHMGSLGCKNNNNPKAAPDDSCSKPNRNEIVLEDFDPSKQAIVADIAEMMAGVDLKGMNHCHGSPSDACPPFYESVGIDYKSGDQLKSQTAFRAGDQ